MKNTRLDRNRQWLFGLFVTLVLSVGSTAVADADARLKAFSTQKRQQTDQLAAKLNVVVPPGMHECFKAAEAGDTKGVSNCYARILRDTGRVDTSIDPPGFTNALAVPIHEMRCAYHLFEQWDAALLQQFAEGVLNSIPPNSIYLAGTDEGRFAVTMFRDLAQSPDIFIITQNALWYQPYMDYLRATYDNRVWLPTESDAQWAFQDCVKDMSERLQHGEELDPEEHIENANGYVTVTGIKAVMAINGILAEQLFDHNKAGHEFFLEESYVIPWMEPYLEPHGLIMKLNKEPLAKLNENVVARDRLFWDKLTKQLLADPRFVENKAARLAYAKLRAGIAGLYVYRRMTAEAEAACRQALALCPESPYANFRLANFLVNNGEPDQAIKVLEDYQRLDTQNHRIRQAIEQIRTLKQKGSSSNELN